MALRIVELTFGILLLLGGVAYVLSHMRVRGEDDEEETPSGDGAGPAKRPSKRRGKRLA